MSLHNEMFIKLVRSPG